jgi:hypothetical protein
MALHAAFAQVLDASGAAKYIESSWHDMEWVHMLATDGSTHAHLLHVALWKLIMV